VWSKFDASERRTKNDCGHGMSGLMCRYNFGGHFQDVVGHGRRLAGCMQLGFSHTVYA
jgi:hypothetical protein